MRDASFCLVVDASCDLPAHVLQHPQLRVLPVRVVVGLESMMDRRNLGELANFHATALKSPLASGGRSEPLTVDEMVQAFKREISPHFDNGLGVFVASSRSAIYSRAKQAAARVRIESYMDRLRLGRTKALLADCVDSKALFAGYAVQVMHLLDELNEGADMARMLQAQAGAAEQTYAYMVPGNVSYILERASLKGEQSVSGLAAFAAKSLGITPIIRGHCGVTEPVARRMSRAKAVADLFKAAENAIERRLLTARHLCLSYSGPLDDVCKHAGFVALQKTAQAAQTQVHLEVMSMTGSVNVGPNALVLGMLAQPHEFESLM